MEKKMTVRFDEVDAVATDTVVPAGKYRMLVNGFEKSKAKTGTPQIRCDLEILDKPEFEGCEKREYFPLDEKALWRIVQFIKVLTDTSKLKDREVDVNSIVFDDLLEGCIGKSLNICYGVEDYEGMEKNFSRRYLKQEGEDSPPEKKA